MLDELSATVQVDNGPPPLGEKCIYADGEMAGRIRRFPWETTQLGSICGWSEALLCTVNMVLESQFPTLLAWGPEMVLLYNDACTPLLAEKHPRALGQAAKDCWREAWHILAPKLTPVLEEGAKLYFENDLIPILRNGSLTDIYWTYSYSPVRDAAGAVCGVLVVSHDVTARLTAERERDAIAASLRNVLESTTDGFCVLDRQLRYTYVNDQCARTLGRRPEEMIGKSVVELFPHSRETAFIREALRVLESGQPCHFDAFYPEPLNLWVECHYYPSEHGVSIHFRDVTEQKRTEKALRASESRFRKLFESDMMGVAIPDRFGAFRESNDELLRMTGYTRADQEAGLVRWDTMTPPEYADLDAAHIREAAERGSCTPYQKEYIRKDGARVPILCGYALLEGSEDEYIGFVLDLSEQKRAERELREREEHFRVLAESLPEFVWTRDADGEYIYCNQRLLDYVGQPTEWLRTHAFDAVHPDDRAGTYERWKRSMETGEVYLNEYRLRRHDGAYRHFLARAVPVRDEAGRVRRWLGSTTDVHDQKLAEQALRRTEKLNTAAKLAASMAHEINNPLAGVTNSLYLALQDPSLNPETKGYLQTAEQELRRVAHITTQTLRFHKQSNSPTRVDVCDIVDSVLSLFRQRLANKSIHTKAECGRGAFATCFAEEIRQVVANLVSNALDATPIGGTLHLRVRTSRSWTKQRATGVKIVVADTGHGIPPPLLDRIFEPFISTKDETGIGLGLWVSDGIVRKHGGAIRVRSRAKTQPSGTVFTVFIPSTSISG